MRIKSIFITFVVSCCVCANAFGAGLGNDTDITDYNTKLQTISTLEKDIAILEDELKKCEKSKKGWKAATIAGAIGVVATGVAAGVQGAKISQYKKDIAAKGTEIENKEKELKELEGKL